MVLRMEVRSIISWVLHVSDPKPNAAEPLFQNGPSSSLAPNDGVVGPDDILNACGPACGRGTLIFILFLPIGMHSRQVA